MGLDNGIVIKKITKEQINNIPKYIEVDTDDKNNEVEIAYWRKCWGIRNEIKDALDMYDPEYETIYDKQIKNEDILLIIEILYKFLSEEYWELFSKSIWEYQEMKKNLVQQIMNLKWLYYFMQENDNIEVEFYDSY